MFAKYPGGAQDQMTRRLGRDHLFARQLGGAIDALRIYRILADKCTGCRACVKVCPANCIHLATKPAYRIDTAACTRCGACFTACKFDAIVVE